MRRAGTASGSRGRAGLVAVLVLTAGLVLGAVPAYAADGSKAKKLDLSGVTLKVGYGVVRDTSTHDVRMASGAFDHTPYEIKWVPFTSGSFEAVLAGAVDLTPDTLVPNVILAQGGAKTPWTRATAPITLIGASVAPPQSGAVIGAHPGSSVKKVADLKGKKVAFTEGGISQLYWLIASRDAKLKPGDVQEVKLPVSEARAAFLSGAVDALVGQHRTFLPLLRDGSAQIIANSNGAAPEYRVTAVRSGFLDDKAQAAAVADFYKRLVKSKQWLVKHYPEAAAIYQRDANVIPEDAMAGVKEMPATVLQLDSDFAAKVQEQTKLFYNAGVIPTKPKFWILFNPDYATRSRARAE